ncbi:MAG: hypothetical protein P0Y53_23785 [Candidatus Pseudobacter hemicellulosilyticus]|uniref:Uncharacterized protein n=1 Tax=Candidatus Pseudobacter hemicellulosilyticus TaxID=3121375 RepID=A0AAJ6BFV7_9BACT|nr:MAG: hypothetical protein P0Y53_23785 [Pseudobacter sp.]
MKFNLQTITATIPIIGILVYLIGFISLSSYLNSVGINLVPSLDARVLQIGILSFVIQVPPSLFLYFSLKPNILSNKSVQTNFTDSLFNAYGFTLLYSYLLTRYLTDYKGTLWFWLSFAIVFIISKYNNKYAYVAKTVLVCGTCFFLLFLLFFVKVNILYQVILIHQCILFSYLIYIAYAKNNISHQIFSAITLFLAWIISSAFIGSTVVPEIKSQYGGLKILQSKYYFNFPSGKFASPLPLQKYLTEDNSAILNLLYENTENYYFLVQKDTVITVPKSYVTFVVTNK